MAIDVKVIGLDKQVHDLEWARAKYGVNALSVDPITGPGYRLIMAMEVTGMLATTCTVLGANGQGIVGAIVDYIYPEPPSHWDPETAMSGGTAEHSMGPNEGYDPRNAMGPASWKVRDANCERVKGLGWLAYTNHEHMNIVVQWTDGDTPPPDNGGCLPGWLRGWLEKLLAR
jgi:hypothetical protein